jgi:hypothetical protein
MKEQVLNALQALGFQLEEMEDLGYGFRYEGIDYLYMPNDNDDDFLSISVPGLVEITEENAATTYKVMDRINATVKYVKANKMGRGMWMFYERELFGGEDLEILITRMVLHLESAVNFFRNALERSMDDDEESEDNVDTNENNDDDE